MPKEKAGAVDVRSYVIRLDPEGQRALRILAAELDTTVQEITIDALNAKLKKHGKTTIIRNPRGRVGRPRRQ